jgi:hypothetical protein
MARKRRRRSFWIASIAIAFLCGCTPREIEQESVREMPRPGGGDQQKIDSIKRELNRRRQQGSLEVPSQHFQQAMDSLKYNFLIKPYLEKDESNR